MNVILSRTLLKIVDVSEKCVTNIRRLKELTKLNKSSNTFEFMNEYSNDSIGEFDDSCTKEDTSECSNEAEKTNLSNFKSKTNSFKHLSKTHPISLSKKYEKRRQMYEQKRILLNKSEPIYNTSPSHTSFSQETFEDQSTPQTSRAMSR